MKRKVKLTKSSFTALLKNNNEGCILRDLGITTIEEMRETFVDGRSYKRINFSSKKWPSLYNDFMNITENNYFLAKQLFQWNLISEESYRGEEPIYMYHHYITKKSRKKLYRRGWCTIGDLRENCMNPDGSFKKTKRGDGIGIGINYQIATILNRSSFIKDEEFVKVPKPEPRLRIPTKEEIGNDGEILIKSLEWTDGAKRIITISVHSLAFKQMGYNSKWENFTLSHLVQRFVRIDMTGNTHFNKKGHIRSLWYNHENATGELDLVLEEIRKKLEELNFLLPEKPE